MPFVNEQNGDNADQADTGQQSAPPSGTLGVVAHPDYVFAFAESPVYLASDDAPLKWIVTRKDGALVAVPTGGQIVVRDEVGNVVASLTPDLESNVPALAQVVAQLWQVPPIGDYTAEISLDIGDDGQVRSDRERIWVT